MKTSRSLALSATLLVGVTALSGCDASIFGTTYDKQVTRSANTGAEGKAEELLASWVPDEASNIEIAQRTTGDERLLKADYSGDLPSSCLTIETAGSPTEDELEDAYSTDSRMDDLEVSEVETTPLLSANWWPEGQEESTTELCGRWWVSQDGDTLYAFAAERSSTAELIRTERADNN